MYSAKVKNISMAVTYYENIFIKFSGNRVTHNLFYVENAS